MKITFGSKDRAKEVTEMLDGFPEVPLSEGMIKRDNFFHNCWMKLKMERQDLCEVMQKVELNIAGYDPDYVEPSKPEDQGILL